MNPISKRIVLRASLVCAALATFVAAYAQVPSRLMPPDGNVEVMRAYARGVQVYVSVENPNLPGTFVWKFVAPLAILANNGGRDFGTHFAGPTWRADNTGSSVKATRVDGLPVDPTAIDWLLLSGRDHAGKGMFGRISYIQRIDTVGGLMPSWTPMSAGIEASIPYTATYVFFEATSVRP